MRYLQSIILVALVLCPFPLTVSGAYAEAGSTGVPVVFAQSNGASAPSGWKAEGDDTVFLPVGDLFKPLIADPKEPRFYLSYILVKYQSTKVHGAVGGYGEIFGLYRHNNPGGYSWQANFGGGIHAQFDLHAPSLDVVNADYTIGFPFSIRKNAASYRITVFHQSSHLGDEYLLHNTAIERVELSYEAIQALGSYEWSKWRVYYGGDVIIHQGPTDLKPFALQAGVEYYDTEPIVGRGRLVGGWDLKSDQTHDWNVNSSVKAGLQFDSSESNGRYVRVLAEAYKGFAPYGQFYSNRMTYVGVGVALGLE